MRSSKEKWYGGFVNEKQVKYGVGILIVLLLVARYWSMAESMLGTVWKAILPFIYGAILAYIINILMEGIENFTKNKILKGKEKKWIRGMSLTLSFFVVVFVFVALFSIIVPQLIKSVQSLLQFDVSIGVKSLVALGNDTSVGELLESFHIDTSSILSKIGELSKQLLSTIGTILTTLLLSVSSIFSTIVNTFMAVIFAINILLIKEVLSLQIIKLFNTYIPKVAPLLCKLAEVFNQNFKTYFITQTLEACILGSLCFMGMLILHLPYAGTISILVGFTALIPIVGAWVGTAVGFVMILTSSVTSALIFIIFFLILQQFENNIIYPKVVGNAVGLPGIWVLVSVAVGGSVGGMIGMLIGVPFAASIYQLVSEDMEKRKIQKIDG